MLLNLSDLPAVLKALVTPPPAPTTAPPQAATAGFTTLVTDEQFVNWTQVDATTYQGDSGLWYNSLGFNNPTIPAPIIHLPGALRIFGGMGLTTHARVFPNGGTVGSRNYLYGYFEAIFKINVPYPGTGQTPWTSFWLFSSRHQAGPPVVPDEWSEIDIIETPFFPSYGAAIHDWRDTGTGPFESPAQSPAFGQWNTSILANADMSQYHKYGLLWKNGVVEFYFDDVLVQSAVPQPITNTDPQSINISGQNAAADGTFKSVRVWSGSPYTTAALAVFAAMTTPPSAARKTIINNLIVALQAAGIWDSLDLLYLVAAADSQAARLNWKNPGTFTAAGANGPTFVADRGYTGDGATSRLVTGYTPSTQGVQFTRDDASLWSWSRTNAVVAASDIGSLNNPASLIAPRNTGDVFTYEVNGNAYPGPSNSDSSGFSGAQRVSSATIKAWRNGAQVGANGASVSTGISNQDQWILGADAIQFSTRQIAAAAWGASLTGKETAFYNAMLTYMQAVGAA